MGADRSDRRTAIGLLLQYLRSTDPSRGPLPPSAVAAVVVAEELLVDAGSPAARAALVEAVERLRTEPDDAAGASLGGALRRIERGIEQQAQNRPVTAGVVNPEAGQHMVAVEERHLRAAVRAGRRSLEAMPYYEIRYGVRGRRFTGSDSAWLAGLTTHSPDVVASQVGWLARVLASRGMPSWLLETHLDVLVEELAVLDVDGHRLADAAEDLRRLRRRYVPDEVLQAADSWMADHLPADAAVEVPRAGTLLAAEHADGASGLLADDATPCASWLQDPGRFPPRWCATMHRVRDRLAG